MCETGGGTTGVENELSTHHFGSVYSLYGLQLNKRACNTRCRNPCVFEKMLKEEMMFMKRKYSRLLDGPQKREA